MSEKKEIYQGCIGIDLGTTYSCVAVWLNDHVEVIPNDMGHRTTPSWVAMVGAERIVGTLAKQQANNNPTGTLYDIKRFIGKSFNDPVLQDDLSRYSFQIKPDSQDRPIVGVDCNGGHKDFTAEEISAMVLAKMRQSAEDYLGKKVVNAVITVPAYFNDAQRTATKNSAQIAGLNCLRIINEPTAACLCYGLHKKVISNVIIFDLGGGTLDVSLLELNHGVFEVKATSGNTHLGGEDFDNRLVDHFRQIFEKNSKRTIPETATKTLRKLKETAETVKNNLSQMQTVRVDIDALYDGIDFKTQMTRETFEGLCIDLFNDCLNPIRQVLEDAKLTKKEIDEVVLVGGATRIPKIQEMLTNFFDGKQLNKSVNPDEAVASGAAIQGAILTQSDTSGTTKDLLLVDVIPLSLGIETTGGLMATIIARNSSIPCEKSAMFSTVEDNQSVVLVQVYEGERKFTKDNHRLGTFELTGIPKAMRGVPKIEVTFKMDANGILNVVAFEKASQISQSVTITKESGRLTSEEIQRMIDDAERYRGADEIKKEMVEYRTSFDKYLQMSQKTVNDSEFPDALTDEEKSYANQLILNACDWLNATDPLNGQLIERSKEELMNCKDGVEHYLKPLINKVYARQMIKNGTSTKKEKSPTIAQVNQVLEQLETRSTSSLISSPPAKNNTGADIMIKKKVQLKLKKIS